jgi:hypothetical protein
MRLSVTSLRRMVKRPLRVEFVHQELTSYSGLGLLRRYLRQLDLPRRLRAACVGLGGDYGGARLGRLVRALFYVGARRLEPPLSGRGSLARALLRIGTDPDRAHRRQLAAAVHDGHAGSARAAQSRYRPRRHCPAAAPGG